MFQSNMFEGHIPLFGTSHNKSADSGDLARQRNEEFESKLGTQIEKRRYHRHTQHQTEIMEKFFKECPRPDHKQRKELGRQVGLEPNQVKFWFQNKHTQMKSQNERNERQIWKSENEKLRAENNRYKQILSNAVCPKCTGPASLGDRSFIEQELRTENARLKEELDRVSGIVAKYVEKSLLSDPHLSFGGHSHSIDHGSNSGTQAGDITNGVRDAYRSFPRPTDADKHRILELAVASMNELIMIAQAGEPLWTPAGDDNAEVLNWDEYLRSFPIGIGPIPLGFKSEASRESAVVPMNRINLVEILMDVNKWSSVFCGIISRAMTLDVLLTGVAGNYNGALQVMTAETQVPSPLVPTREYYFVRHCKQHADGIWAVVDVFLDSIRPSPISRSRRRPSGCLIQELSNGYSKLTWVEHVEVDDRNVHNMYKALVNSGFAFGAKRWMATLDHQCERLASNISAEHLFGVIKSAEGRKGILKLAERMVKSFYSGVGASTAHSWTTLSATTRCDDVRVMTKNSVNDPGTPRGIMLSAATSFWIHVPPKRVFDFLRNENSRNEWDILSSGGVVQEMAHVASGRDPSNYVSLLQVNGATSSQSNMLILQENSSDPTGSYVVYAPVDANRVNVVLNGGDPDYVPLLPSGFAILPDSPGAGGSLLTVSFQISVASDPLEKLSLDSVATVKSLIKGTIERIKTGLNCESAQHVL